MKVNLLHENIGDHDKKEQDSDYGGVVSGLFGNLRIPAVLLAGASVAQAYAMPLSDTDGLQLGLIKRAYVLCILGCFCSMLLTVLLSTAVMTDIALSNARLAKNPSEYINRYYALDYMLTKLNFFAGSAIFAIGTMLRGLIFLNFGLVAKGVLGIMGSFTLMSMGIVLEYSRRQTGKSLWGQMSDTFLLMKIKARTNKLFGIGVILFVSTLCYLVAMIPHIVEYLTIVKKSGKK